MPAWSIASSTTSANSRDITRIIEGGARGDDTLGRLYGERHGIPVTTFHAEWKRLGRAAGPIRNKRMLDEGKPDLVVASPGGTGIANMMRQARAAGVEVIDVAAGGAQ